MVTGFNVNLQHGGKTYHVQTEDRGRKNPVIETLVYMAGKILHQERVSYADQNDDASYDEANISKLVDMQHRRMIDQIKGGRFDTDRRPFGEEFITNRSFDDVVLEFLIEEARNQSLSIGIVGQSEFSPGAKAHVVVRATHKNSSGPIAGAVIRGRVIRSAGGPVPLGEVKTDAKGEAKVEFTVPEGDGNAAVIVQAESEFGRDELQRLIR